MSVQNKIRDLQDNLANKDWRIEFISHAEDGKPMVHSIKNPMGWLSLAGALLFLGSIAYLLINRSKLDSLAIPITLCVIGVFFGAIGSILHDKFRKQNWRRVDADCLDHELKRGVTHQNSRIWLMRTLCRFEINGEEIQCTPQASWSLRNGEEWKSHYIKSSPGGGEVGQCKLLVNPDNPRETDLLKQS